MTKTRLFRAAAAGAVLLSLAACATPEAPEGGVRIDQQNDIHPALNSVRVIDAGLARYAGARHEVKSVLDVEGVYLSTTPTGFRKVTVQIRNKTDVAIPIEARASWFDAAGVPTDAAQSWTRLFVQPQAMVTFEQVSARLPSTQYYVEIRGAQ
ncbi:putative periplasmic lipoprotein [Phenylobacterium soli]|uniref:DUF1425 domain-containing protein n=1 Tax=Phenylobacterium soli TaxID=2170551 RepID=A0A328AGR2_9CAUL|nr:DUF1425 domain-containing protein [Phenylobacterium soli]RAK53707.1 hypothetical protein DJ017_03775 [Phenylobacterium soli]